MQRLVTPSNGKTYLVTFLSRDKPLKVNINKDKFPKKHVQEHDDIGD
jgi:hypothetical protein